MARPARYTGLQGNIVGFFERNPDEVLRAEDICLKWDATKRQVNAALCHLRKQNEVYTVGQTVMKARLHAGD